MRWGAVLLTMLTTAIVVTGCDDQPAATPKATTTTTAGMARVCDEIDINLDHENRTGLLASGFGWRLSRDWRHLLTTVNGDRWQSTEMPDLVSLYEIEFVDPLRGWMGARAVEGGAEMPGIFRTINGGRTWAFSAMDTGPGLHGGAFMTIDFDASKSQGMVVTGDPVGEGGAVATTNDEGATWRTWPKSIQVLGSKLNLAFGTAWLSSVDPRLHQLQGFFSSRDGQEWTAHQLIAPREGGGPPILGYDVPRFADARHGTVAAIARAECDEHPRLIVATTEDGGTTWQILSSSEILLPQGGAFFGDLTLIYGADVWWATVTRGSVDPDTAAPAPVVMQSSDHGLTWTAAASVPDGAAIVASDGARRVWASVGDDNGDSNSTLYESRDSGATWTDITPPR